MSNKFHPRRPYDDDAPEGMLESDRDFIENNHELIMEFLENMQRTLNDPRTMPGNSHLL